MTADKELQPLEGTSEINPKIYSKSVRAGKRTYFFDVRATRNDDYYLTITESRKKQTKEGDFIFEKHKIYLYKEDFDKFANGLDEIVAYIKEFRPDLFMENEEKVFAVDKNF